LCHPQRRLCCWKNSPEMVCASGKAILTWVTLHAWGGRPTSMRIFWML
jgi:hypothetical protein